jgi:thymidylate kinase
VRIIAETLSKTKGPIFDAKKFALSHHSLPSWEDMAGCSLLVTTEPSYAWVGAGLREELVQHHDHPYSTLAIAQAFALDRLIHYKRLVLPARNHGCTIIQERGVSSSLAYQSCSETGLPMKIIAEIEGNAYALANPPDVLILARVPVDVALTRLESRTDKKDNAIFERRDFLERLDAQYDSPEFRSYVGAGATKIIDFSTDCDLAIMEERTVALVHELFS